ncbi:K(+)/H(+) antiporter [Dinochytrium kinnereticum]|nr:K(+)/H(+) antiporter [Dinochytrium kinnereticum]
MHHYPFSQQLTLSSFSPKKQLAVSYIRLPRVVAEVLGGIVLGSSALSQISSFKSKLFPEKSLDILRLVGEFGLLFYLFLVGLELDPQFFVKNVRKSVMVSLSGILVPFGAAIGAATLLYTTFSAPTVPYVAFFIFVAAVMSMTHFPAIARILTERKLLGTSVGKATLAAASVDDVIAWSFLLFVIALVNNPGNALVALYVFLVMVAYTAFLWLAIRPFLIHWVEVSNTSDSVSQILVFAVLAMVLVSGFFTQALGAHALFGGFLVGVIVPHGHSFAINLVEKLEDMINIVFLPIYFAYAGFHVRLDMLNDGSSWGLIFLFVVLSSVGKILGAGSAAKLIGAFSMRESLAIGVLMNTKGLLEFIILNIGVQSQIINPKIYTILIVAVLISNITSLPLISLVYPTSLYLKKAPGPQVTQEDDTAQKQKTDAASTVTRKAKHLNLLCYLPGMSTIPAMMALTDLLKQQEDLPMSVIALRLIRLSDRHSTVMMATDADSTLRSDPVTSVFRTFGHLNQIGVSSVLAVANIEEFPDQIVAAAANNDANLLLIPWQHAADLSSLVDENHIHSLVDAVQRDAPCTVAVFIDRGFGVLRGLSSSSDKKDGTASSIALSLSTPQRIFIPYFGGRDDKEALQLAVHLARGAAPAVQITILRITSPKADTNDSSSQTLLPSDSGDEFLKGIREELGRGGFELEYAETRSSAPVSAVIAKAGEVANEHGDLIVVGANAYANQSLKVWVDRETIASVITVQGHATRSLVH